MKQKSSFFHKIGPQKSKNTIYMVGNYIVFLAFSLLIDPFSLSSSCHEGRNLPLQEVFFTYRVSDIRVLPSIPFRQYSMALNLAYSPRKILFELKAETL